MVSTCPDLLGVLAGPGFAGCWRIRWVQGGALRGTSRFIAVPRPLRLFFGFPLPFFPPSDIGPPSQPFQLQARTLSGQFGRCAQAMRLRSGDDAGVHQPWRGEVRTLGKRSAWVMVPGGSIHGGVGPMGAGRISGRAAGHQGPHPATFPAQ
jgi:hypothetical protein